MFLQCWILRRNKEYIYTYKQTAYPTVMYKYAHCVRNFISCLPWTVTAFDTKFLEPISASWCSIPKILQRPTVYINKFLVFDTESFFEKLVGLPITTGRLARRGFVEFPNFQNTRIWIVIIICICQ